jgi:hypothetical protein
MSTVAAAPERHTPAAGTHDRVFYSAMSLALALTVLIGFSPTYYLRLVGDAPATTISGRPASLMVHLHAVLFTGWVLLFIIQTSLVATHRVKLHQRLGIAGAVLALAMVIVGVRTAIDGALAKAAPPGADPLAFMAVPLFDVLLFAGFVTLAMLLRRNREAHKRLMLLAYISIIAAAIARLPGVLPMGPFAFFGFALVFVVFGIVYDLWSRRSVHKVYIIGGLVLLISVPLRLMISGTPAWRKFADWLIS